MEKEKEKRGTPSEFFRVETYCINHTQILYINRETTS